MLSCTKTVLKVTMVSNWNLKSAKELNKLLARFTRRYVTNISKNHMKLVHDKYTYILDLDKNLPPSPKGEASTLTVEPIQS